MTRGEIFKKELTKQLKECGVKSKDMKRLLRAYTIMEDIAFDIHKDVKELFAAYEISEYILN